MRADTDRPESQPQPSWSQNEDPQERAAPPPDLDDLARKVYAVLKRRLAVEQRRRG
jgi:hypothetical protein